MKKSILTTLLLSFVLLFNACKSGKTYELKMRLAEGDHFEQNMQMDMRMHYGVSGQSMNMKMGMDMACFFDVLKSEADKKFKMTYTRSKMTMDMGQLGAAANIDSVMNRISNKIAGKSITIVLSKDNEIKDVLGAEVFDNEDADPEAREMTKKMFSKDQINQLFGMMFSLYPDKPVAVGDSWSKDNKVNVGEFEMKIKTKFTLASISGNTASITVDGTIDGKGTMKGAQVEMDMKGTQKGTMAIDLTSGYLQKGKYTMLITADMNVAGQKIPMTIDADYNMHGK